MPAARLAASSASSTRPAGASASASWYHALAWRGSIASACLAEASASSHAAEVELDGCEVGPHRRVVRCPSRRFLQRVGRRLRPLAGVEREPEIGPGLGRSGVDVDGGANLLDRVVGIAHLQQPDAEHVQRGGMIRIGVDQCLVAEHRFAQLSAAMEVERRLERGGGTGRGQGGHGKKVGTDGLARRRTPRNVANPRVLATKTASLADRAVRTRGPRSGGAGRCGGIRCCGANAVGRTPRGRVPRARGASRQPADGSCGRRRSCRRAMASAVTDAPSAVMVAVSRVSRSISWLTNCGLLCCT